MFTGKKFRFLIYFLAALVAIILLLAFSPLAGTASPIQWYYSLIGLLYLLLLCAAFLYQLQHHWRVKHKSYLDKDNTLKKKLLSPTSQEVKNALLAAFVTPRYIICAALLALVLYINYLLTYYPYGIAGLPTLLFDLDAKGKPLKSNIWLAITSVSMLFLALIIIRQNHHLRQSSKLAGRQNLIINAHSNISLANLRLIFTDINRMFLASNKLEYILNAKPLAIMRQAKEQALLNVRVNIKLNNDYSLTEFYIRQLSIFVGDMAIECDNYQSKFHQIFAVDNEFVLNFYIRFTDVDTQQLAAKFTEAKQLKLYYNFVVKNSFSVITDTYGSAVYERADEESNDLSYCTKDNKANQYFYI